jgi:hypothetical protein
MSSTNPSECPYENTKKFPVEPEIPYNVPGVRLESFEYTLIDEIVNPNCGTQISLLNNSNTEVVLQPILSSIFEEDTSLPEQGIIYTNVFITENYKKPLEANDFNIYQNFTLDINGNYTLSYCICFKRSGEEKEQINNYRVHRLAIHSIPIDLSSSKDNSQLLNFKIIDNVMAFVMNINPKTSRGTETTVKNASGG